MQHEPPKEQTTESVQDLAARLAAENEKITEVQGNPPVTETVVPEPTIWETLGRMARENAWVASLVGFAAFTNWLARLLGQQGEWWVILIQNGSSGLAVLLFFVVNGCETVTHCIDAIERVKQRLRKR